MAPPTISAPIYHVSSPNGANCTGVASSSNGQILYASFSQLADGDFYVSANSGSSWAPLVGTSPLSQNSNYTDITCNSDGSVLYSTCPFDGFIKSTNSGASWTFIENGPSGEAPNFMFAVATDSTGNKFISYSDTSNVYLSFNSGTSWTNGYSFNGSIGRVACSSDFSKRYVTDGTGNIYTSTDSNNLIWTLIPGNVTSDWKSLSCNASGDKVFAVNQDNELWCFIAGVSKNLGVSTGYGAISSYSDGSGLVSQGSNYFNTYTISYVNVPCFKEDTKILCSIYDKNVYVRVQDIRKGVLVKTLRNGYVPVNMIGTTKLYNSLDELRGKDKMYRCKKSKYPELFEDLIITGSHSILVDDFKEGEREKTIEINGQMINGQICVTDGKYRLPACVDERAVPYEEEGIFNIYHIALDHENYYINYGIYANGLLVETCSKRYLKELSGMKLLE